MSEELKKDSEPSEGKFIGDVLREDEEKKKRARMTDLLCDKTSLFLGKICGGRLYKTHSGVMFRPIRPDIQYIRLRCEKCGKKYRMDAS